MPFQPESGLAPGAGRPESKALSQALLSWYDGHARPLPWRTAADPYRVLVSEFMLQQTQVATVLPYYERFLARFPDVSSLAAADEEEVVRVWEGLGYYRRARYLHQAAREIVSRFGGQIPADPEELRELPGVGAYTAGAVASIAFGRKVPAVDGNVLRVAARLFNIQDPVDSPAGRKQAVQRVAELVPAERPGDFNQALMELGATVCTPRAPACGECPVAGWCEARRAGTAARLPARSRRQAVTPRVPVAVALISDVQAGDWSERLHSGRILVVRRPPGTLLGGLWALPCLEGEGSGPGLVDALGLAGLVDLVPGPLAELVHAFSHRRWNLCLYGLVPARSLARSCADVEKWREAVSAAVAPRADAVLWADGAQREQLAFPRPFRRLLAAMAKKPGTGT